MKRFLGIIFLVIVTFTACLKDPVIPNEEELITTVRYTLTPVAGGSPVVLSWTDFDGDGGGAPVLVGGTLQATTTYQGTLEILDESVAPADDISSEILEEAEAHQLFFEPAVGLNLTVAYADADGNNHPVGLETILQTGAASSGTVRITLRHELDKSAAGVAEGDITNAGGETDVETELPISIE